MPPKNATGTNTAESTNTIATKAPATSFIARLAATRAETPSETMMRSTFSSTTMASSTTIPMASVMAKSVSVLSEKSNAHNPTIVPIKETGTAIIGMRVARQLCKKR